MLNVWRKRIAAASSLCSKNMSLILTNLSIANLAGLLSSADIMVISVFAHAGFNIV